MLKDKNIKDYISSIFERILAQILWTLLFAGITSALAYFITLELNFTTREIIFIIVALILLIFFISYFIYRRTNKRLPNLPAIHPDFHMVREERVHKWVDTNNYIHIRRYTLKALQDGLDRYTDKFYWSGSTYELIGGNSDYSVELSKDFKNAFNIYHFKFVSPLKKNDIIEVEAKWKAVGPAKPFFSTTIEEPTDLLIMKLELYPESGVTQINCEVESYKGARIPIITKKERLNSEGEFTWQIKKPKILHHYEIYWKV